MHKKVMTAMGRKVIHHSPPKHPEQGDPQSAHDAMLLKQDEGRGSGTYGGMRKDTMPMQQESPKPAKALDSMIDYLGRLGGKKK